MDRQWVTRVFADLKYANLDDLERVIAEAREAEKAGTWRQFSVHVCEAHEYDSTYLIVSLDGERLENDEEFAARKKQEEKAAEYRRQMYDNLKREFESK